MPSTKFMVLKVVHLKTLFYSRFRNRSQLSVNQDLLGIRNITRLLTSSPSSPSLSARMTWSIRTRFVMISRSLPLSPIKLASQIVPFNNSIWLTFKKLGSPALRSSQMFSCYRIEFSCFRMKRDEP